MAWWAYQPWKLLVFAPVLALSTLVGGFAIALLASFISPRTLSRVVAGTWARLNARMTPIRVLVSGAENVDPATSYVVVSNHQSHYDVLVLYGWLGIDFRWVMKMELRKIPGLGVGCERLGHIFIDRSNRQAAVASIKEAMERITGGTSVLFFPEGTRSDDGRLKNFKRGAFRFAVDAGLPILPVTVSGTRNVLPARSFDLFPGSARLVIHPPIATKGLGSDGIADLADTTRTVIASALEQPA